MKRVKDTSNIVKMEKKLAEMKKKYSHFIEEGERKKKRQQDIHFTKKDQQVLISSFVVANLLEHGIRRIFI